MTVGERIKELRTKLGMSQVDFADKLNVSKQTLYKYENNIITNIPSDKVETLYYKKSNIFLNYKTIPFAVKVTILTISPFKTKTDKQ